MNKAVAKPHIVALDSGVGGLSICQPFLQRWPRAHFSYVCDNGFFPYGTKDEAALRERIRTIVVEIIQPLAADLLVVACGTASTLALDLIRELISIPVIGVVPAIKPAALQTTTKVIGLLATPGTVNRSYTTRLIQQFAEGCEVVKVGSDTLVRLVEGKLRGLPIDMAVLRAEIAPLFVTRGKRRTDAIVLGCTHFPLAQAELLDAAPWPVSWLEPADAILRRAESLLANMVLEEASRPTTQTWIFTADAKDNSELTLLLKRRGFSPRVHVMPSF